MNAKNESSVPQNRSPFQLKRTLKIASILFAVGLVLLLGNLEAQHLFLPGPLERVGHWIYRLGFLLCLPVSRFLVAFIHPGNYGLVHWIVTSFATPIFFWGVWKVAKFVGRHAGSAERIREHAGKEEKVDRRLFIEKAAVTSFGIAAGGLGIYTCILEPEYLRIRRFEMPIKNLPPELDGLRIVQVSDTHYGPYNSLSFLKKAVEEANRLKGDLIVLTGDYVHRTPQAIEPGIHLLQDLRAPLGVVGVLGNHDHWLGSAQCRSMFHRLGVPLIDNDRVFLTRDGMEKTPNLDRCICVGGVGDLWTDEVSFAKAFKDAPEGVPRLLLSHNPDVAEKITPRHQVNLMLSGHTHGGQVRLPFVSPGRFAPTDYGEKYLGGLCHGPGCPVVVSRGVGVTVVPFRFRVPPELVEITLVKA